MAVVWSLAVLLIVGAVCQAAPARPVGYYTFDGKSLRPLNVVQRRSDDDGFSFGGRNGWKLPFAKPAFLSALTDRNEEERPTISSDHLLPDYLTHQEFLKPQLQAAGFSGGRIIAGPFPVPLAGLPKPPPRSGTVPPIPVTPATVVSKVKFQQQQQQQQQQTQTSIPTFVYKATPPPASYKPVQFPAIQSVPAKVVAVRPPATQPQQQQQAKLVYPIPASSSVHWHAAHQSGPERPVSALGVASYSHPATLVSESAGGSTRLSYGGWTPIYSASYAHVQTQQESVPPVQPQSFQLHPQPELKSEGSSSSSYLDGEEKIQEPVVIEALVPERQVVNQPEAQQSLDEDSQVVEPLEPEVDLIPRVIITGSSPLSFEPKKIRKEKQENKSVVDTPVVVVIAASSEDGPAQEQGPIESPSSNVPVVTEAKRTVRKRKAKQVPSWKRPSSMESASHGHGRAVNQEMPIVTASSSYLADAPSPLLPDSDSSSSSALLSGRGQGQGRYVGRVLPASLFEDDASAVLVPVEDQAVGSAPVGWRETVLLS